MTNKDTNNETNIDPEVVDLLPSEENIEEIKKKNLPKLRVDSGISVVKNKTIEKDADLAADADFIKARNTIYETIEIAQEAIQEMRDIAEQSGHPKAYEVLNQYVKTLSKISKDLVELHKIKIETQNNKSQSKNNTDDNEIDGEKRVTNNNLIMVATTAELQKIMKDIKNEK